ncbi:hypothetical protein FQN54_006968 [Arachnomyces sp. PD_36]|nr:hypothetical protein FQN54_006968 [Arachnomyces sp. PD_36]
MSGAIAKMVGKTLLKESAANHFGKEDPYFEKVPATRLQRAFGKKTQKRRKAIPPGVSEHDGKVLTKVKRRAYRLDYALCNLCGIQFGWSSVIAIIPVAGDVMDVFLALMVMRSCSEIEGGLPASLRTQMLFNVIIDFLVGLVPFVGDIADALYKCNTRNAILLENYLRKQHEKRAKRGRQAVTDPTDPDEFDRIEELDTSRSPPRSAERKDTEREQSRNKSSSRPAPAPEASGGRGWAGGRREGDLEQGTTTR